jgi:hypothetical protein
LEKSSQVSTHHIPQHALKKSLPAGKASSEHSTANIGQTLCRVLTSPKRSAETKGRRLPSSPLLTQPFFSSSFFKPFKSFEGAVTVVPPTTQLLGSDHKHRLPASDYLLHHSKGFPHPGC